MKKKVLIVDDDAFLCEFLAAELSLNEELEMLVAHNGHEAMDKLAAQTIDLFVTDLQMPEMDGFALIAYVGRHYPELPFIIMTAHHSEDVEKRLEQHGISAYMRKPFKPEDLSSRITGMLRLSHEGFINGISVAPFLQLLEMERKTCTLTLSSGTKTGQLFIVHGSLIDAIVGDQRGENAALTIISWDSDVKIEIDNHCPELEKSISRDLRYLIMESMRLLDESLMSDSESLVSQEPDLGFHLQSVDVGPDLDTGDELDDIPIDQIEAIDSLLQGLSDIGGIKGAAVMNAQGRILVEAAMDASYDFHGELDGLSQYIPTHRQIPGEKVKETVFRTADRVVVILNQDEDAVQRFHLVVIIGDERSEGLLKLRLRRLMPKIMARIGSSLVPTPPS